MNRLHEFHLWSRNTPRNTDCIECPNCNRTLEVNDDRWSEDRSDYESGLIECPVCKQDFLLTVRYIMHVSASKKE